MNTLPKISIITPSYNQGNFIEETILSVLGQQYPNLEYIIIDGGSTDNTVEVIKKYTSQITYWVSEKDNGQSEAINKGFSMATGDILGWLNSDDTYLPGTLNYIANTIDPSGTGIYFGNAVHLIEEEAKIIGSNVKKRYNTQSLHNTDFIIQPSSFWTKKTWLENQQLEEKLHFGFDWEWFLRAQKKGIPLHPLDKYLSVYRIHENHKSGSAASGEKRRRELRSVIQKYGSEKNARLFDILCQQSNSFPFIKKLSIRFDIPLYAYAIKIFSPFKYWAHSSKDIMEIVSMV